MFMSVRRHPRMCSGVLRTNVILTGIFTLLGVLSSTSSASSLGADLEHGVGVNRTSASGNRDKRFHYYSDLGIVTKQSDTICLTIKNSTLTPGTRVYLVAFTTPQIILETEVSQAHPVNCMKIDASDTVSGRYELRMIHGSSRFSVPAVAVVNPVHPISISRGSAGGDLDGDGRREYFRECTSSEGVHLSVWTGKPLVGRRRWHEYYSLGYDVEPDCTSKDTGPSKR
jgi:hypothetical protein